MQELETEFPTPQSKYLKPSNFQDNPITVKFKGWYKNPNEDDPQTKKNAKTWKQKLKFMLPYSYPEWATDEAGEKKLDQEGNPFRNRYWLKDYPHGYTICYVFEQGELETGSKPLYEAFGLVRPKVGEEIVIKRTGKDRETQWFVGRPEEKPVEIQMDAAPGGIDVSEEELKPDEETPF